MTVEEIIAQLKTAYPKCVKEVNHRLQGGFDDHNSPLGRAIDEAVKLLEQVPCEDCISRQEAIEAIWDGTNMDIYTSEVKEILEGLSPVKPKVKTGKWERVGSGSLIDPYECSECHREPSKKYIEEKKTWGWDFTQYCPNCGAKMESEEN